MRLLVGAACVAIIAASGFYLTTEITAYAASAKQRKEALAVASFNECKRGVYMASQQKGYQGADAKAATTITKYADNCMLRYPKLADYAEGSALDMVQRKARLQQLTASN